MNRYSLIPLIGTLIFLSPLWPMMASSEIICPKLSLRAPLTLSRWRFLSPALRSLDVLALSLIERKIVMIVSPLLEMFLAPLLVKHLDIAPDKLLLVHLYLRWCNN